MLYFDIQAKWPSLRQQLHDPQLNEILVRDLNKYTYGRWKSRFEPGMYPSRFSSCDWSRSRRGRPPAYLKYVLHGACHWLVNFNLRLASLVSPATWRILTSQHSTVWDGKETLFDINFFACGIDPDECFSLASENGDELSIRTPMEVNYAEHYSVAA